MLVVKVEVWPFGDESKAREIGRAEIGNIKPNVDEWDHYEAAFKGEDPKPPRTERVYLGHYRPDGAWRLIQRALEAAFGDKSHG